VYGLDCGRALLSRPCASRDGGAMLHGREHDQQLVCRALRFDAMHARATG
jgi:hypothetical protein